MHFNVLVKVAAKLLAKTHSTDTPSLCLYQDEKRHHAISLTSESWTKSTKVTTTHTWYVTKTCLSSLIDDFHFFVDLAVWALYYIYTSHSLARVIIQF